MKQFIIAFSCMLLFVININAQVTNKINFQMLVRDASGELLPNGTIGIKFQILQGSNTGSIIFEETHSTSTNALGVTSIKIGGGLVAIGSLNTINWSNSPYYISIGIDPLGGSNYTLQSTSKLNSIPLSASTLKSGLAQTADYNSLTNKPITITSGQIELLEFLTLSNNLDLDILKTAVDLNTSRLFPGFGMTTGTAFEILWTKIGNDVFYENGTVGIGANTNLAANSAVLSVEGGILFENLTTYETEVGALKYFYPGAAHPIAVNGFYFGNNLGTRTEFKSDPDEDVVFSTYQDANIIAKLGIGESIVPSYNFNNNNFVIASSTPSIRFEDTSASGSFPSADWSIEINDDADLGESYFNIANFNTSDSNFKIMAGAPTNAFNILENGNIGLNTIPTTKFEVENTVKANAFIGDASGFTNLPVVNGTANTSNTGSTTLIADNNSDGTGSIIFQTQNQDQLSIASNGNVAIGNINAAASLEVDGNLVVNHLNTENIVLKGQLNKQISLETPTTLSSIDLDDKSIIIMNPSNNTFWNGLINGIEGQVVTLINSSSNSITFNANILTPGGGAVVLDQNESVTLVKSGNSFLILNLVN